MVNRPKLVFPVAGVLSPATAPAERTWPPALLTKQQPNTETPFNAVSPSLVPSGTRVTPSESFTLEIVMAEVCANPSEKKSEGFTLMVALAGESSCMAVTPMATALISPPEELSATIWTFAVRCPLGTITPCDEYWKTTCPFVTVKVWKLELKVEGVPSTITPPAEPMKQQH